MTWLTRLNKPWLHFILLGVVFYQLQGALFPDPKTVIGPLGAARINALEQQWVTNTGRPLLPEQKAKLIAAELDGDMLLQRALELELHLRDAIVYQRLILNMQFLQISEGKTDTELFDEAILMGMHLEDVVVKRRLIQMMQQHLLAENVPRPPEATEIEAEFRKRFEELRRPPRYSFEHIFFREGREPDVPAMIADIRARNLDIHDVRDLSSPFLQGREFARQSPVQLEQIFGREFVVSLQQEDVRTGQWIGPIRSSFGLHYLWVFAYEPARDAELSEVEAQLRGDLEYSEKNRSLQCAIEALRAEYDVRGRDAAPVGDCR